MASALLKLRKLLRSLRQANSANVTVTFALATVPVVGFVGAAVDYSHANAVKAAMQMAADSTALMLSKNAASLATADLQTKANDYFRALYTRTDSENLLITATYDSNVGSRVVIDATTNVRTNFMGLMGFNFLGIKVSSQVKWGNTKLRVALALDVTGSMSEDGKMAALKTATKNLLNQLKAAATSNGDVYVSIIPFSKDVNVNKSNVNADWIDWTDWDNRNGSCNRSPRRGSYDTKSECEAAGGTWTHSNRSIWQGCVTDRGNTGGPHTNNYDTNVTPPTPAIQATNFPAEQFSSCPNKIMALSYDWTAMKDMVDDLNPSGNTNQAIGLAHAWQSLVGGGPYPPPPAQDPNYRYTKVIILMSDGLNTQNRWYSSQTSIDNREALTCIAAKAAGVVIYSVQVNTGGDPTQMVMKNCATSPDKFFELKSASALITAFNSIGTALSNLRIAQ